MRPRLLIAIGSIGLIGAFVLAAPPGGSGHPSANDHLPASRPSGESSPATRPVVSRLLGIYLGTVVDDDETVPALTIFRRYGSAIVGTYRVRDGTPRQYDGTLDTFELLSDERGECRFRWHDKHGEGFLTIRVSPDGSRFDGSWGLEIVQDELVWTGTREADKPARSRR